MCIPCRPGGRFFISTFTFTAPLLPGRKVTVPASLPSAVWIVTTTGFIFAAFAATAVAVISMANIIVRISSISLLVQLSGWFLCVRSCRFHAGTGLRGLHREQIVKAIEVVEETA